MGVNAEINVVSLIDVMMLLMVIFMITAPMLHQGIEVALPRPRHVLRLIVLISAIELGFAANVWASVLANGFVTAAEGWFYIDAFSAVTTRR